MQANPMAYCVTGIRAALYGQGPAWRELGVTAAFAALALVWATWMASRRGNKAG
jgi:hypothetical protein